MSIIFMDGFERYSWSKWTERTEIIYFPTGTSGMTGTYCAGLYHNEFRYIRKIFDASYSEIYGTVKVRRNGSNNAILKLYDSNPSLTVAASIGRNATSGKIELYRGNITDGGVLIATGDLVTNLDTTYSMEFYFKPHNTLGILTVKIDGVEAVTYSGDTTAGLEACQGFSLWGDGYYDDVVISDSEYLGNLSILAIHPNGAGDSTEWTPSTGSNYACVDEVVASDSDYVYINLADKLDLYNFETVTGTVGMIKAIDVIARLSYVDVVTPLNQRIVIRTNATNYTSTLFPTSLSFTDYSSIWDQNPATSTNWTATDLSSLQIGVKTIA